MARETPLDHAQRLSQRLRNEIYLKREDLQPVFSFKLRGAYNRIRMLSAEERAKVLNKVGLNIFFFPSEMALMMR